MNGDINCLERCLAEVYLEGKDEPDYWITIHKEVRNIEHGDDDCWCGPTDLVPYEFDNMGSFICAGVLATKVH